MADQVSPERIRRFLDEDLGREAADVTRIGAGAWSSCFGFRSAGEDLVIRVGRYREDFDMDRRAVAFAAPGLPVPRMLDIGKGLGMFYAITERAVGQPLEQTEEWDRLVGPVADMLEALRTADVSDTSGWGPWTDSEVSDGENSSWSDFLLRINIDRPDWRTHGWMERLRGSPGGDRSFQRGYRMLEDLVSDSVPRSVIHSDLINRNVHVADGTITGVFDWGCSIYGDHLYDLAWFEFWAPWHPALDIDALRDRLIDVWRDAGIDVSSFEARMNTCHLHIGLSHLAYHAFTGVWEELAKVEVRMGELIDGFG